MRHRRSTIRSTPPPRASSAPRSRRSSQARSGRVRATGRLPRSARSTTSERREDRDASPVDGIVPLPAPPPWKTRQRPSSAPTMLPSRGETARGFRRGLGSRRRGLHRGATLPRVESSPTRRPTDRLPFLDRRPFRRGETSLRPERSSVTLAPAQAVVPPVTAQTLLIASLVGARRRGASPVAQAKEKKKSCARAIINDWYGDGQIDKQLRAPLLQGGDPGASGRHQVTYSRAPEDILRALAYASRASRIPAGAPDQSSTDTNPGSSSGTRTRPTGDGTTVTVTRTARQSPRPAPVTSTRPALLDPDPVARARRARPPPPRRGWRRLRQPPPPGTRARRRRAS